MKKTGLRLFTLIIVVCTTINAEAKLTLQEVRSASRDVLVVFFTSDTLNLTEVDISNRSDWKINGQPCLAIFRYATKANNCDHHIYLQTSDLVEGRKYKLTTPYGNN